MDRAYEGDETWQLALDLGMDPEVPPKANRLVKWDYDRTTYKPRNEVERLFRRLKGYRGISRGSKSSTSCTAHSSTSRSWSI